MNIHLYNFSDSSGGAGRATYRIFEALRKEGLDAKLNVINSRLGDENVINPKDMLGRLDGHINYKAKFSNILVQKLSTNNAILHSPAIFPTNFSKKINSSDIDLVHLNWINHEMMSIADIGRIDKPILWTLHDMWGFCGAEHVSYDLRWFQGYNYDNRPKGESGFDLNAWTWHRKIKNWIRPMHIVTPSNWLAECVVKSKLMKDWPVEVIHNPIDTSKWKGIDRKLALEIFGLDPSKRYITFGAMDDGNAYHKGFDLLKKALKIIESDCVDIELITFGRNPSSLIADNIINMKTHSLGKINDDITLRLIYSASSLLVIPSRVDNLPNMGVESLSCGTPIVAFNVCGLSDIVEHKKTGYLANPFDIEDLASGVKWVLADQMRASELGLASREKAIKQFDISIISKKYLNIYKKIINE